MYFSEIISRVLFFMLTANIWFTCVFRCFENIWHTWAICSMCKTIISWNRQIHLRAIQLKPSNTLSNYSAKTVQYTFELFSWNRPIHLRTIQLKLSNCFATYSVKPFNTHVNYSVETAQYTCELFRWQYTRIKVNIPLLNPTVVI